MDLKVLEKGKDRLVVEVRGESHTLLNMLREKAWQAGAGQAAYMIEHPYLSQPKIIVRAKDPKKVLQSAAQLVIDEAKDFERQFTRAVRRK